MALLFGWIIASIIVGAIGESTHKGFWGGFLGSLILSPLIGIIIVLVSNTIVKKCKFCGCDKKETDQFCPGCEKDKFGISREVYKSNAKPN